MSHFPPHLSLNTRSQDAVSSKSWSSSSPLPFLAQRWSLRVTVLTFIDRQIRHRERQEKSGESFLPSALYSIPSNCSLVWFSSVLFCLPDETVVPIFSSAWSILGRARKISATYLSEDKSKISLIKFEIKNSQRHCAYRPTDSFCRQKRDQVSKSWGRRRIRLWVWIC